MQASLRSRHQVIALRLPSSSSSNKPTYKTVLHRSCPRSLPAIRWISLLASSSSHSSEVTAPKSKRDNRHLYFCFSTISGMRDVSKVPPQRQQHQGQARKPPVQLAENVYLFEPVQAARKSGGMKDPDVS